jgi:hypothetical protein
MPHTQALNASIEDFYTRGITAVDIAESLASFDIQAEVTMVRAFMEAKEFDAVGLREEGIVTSYVLRKDLTNADLQSHRIPFERGDVLPAQAPLYAVILLLDDAPRVFVEILGHPGGIITREDVQKPPVRMWIFGIITMLETAFNRLLKSRFPEDGWREFTTENRLSKAAWLQRERAKRGEKVPLANCLQFSDKGQILFRDPEIREMFNLPSRQRATRAMRELEHLRNHLAHSEDILAQDWDALVRLCGAIGLFPKLLDME